MGLAFLLGHFFGSLALAGMWVATFVAERMAELPPTPERESLVVGRAEAPDTRQQAEQRVPAVKQRYGELLSDVGYRIENSALFDPAVEQTREFTLNLARWDDDDRRAPDEMAALARPSAPERTAALARANHILAALALYYLPGPADVKALGHALPELEA